MRGGSFTGAKAGGAVGKFELANKGTIFLDEIGEMPMEAQVTLLRVLQNREVVRIGGTHPIKVDVRVIAATNKELTAAIQDHTFRLDLFYRLNILTLDILPLRERKGDIRVLAENFLDKYVRASHNNVRAIDEEVFRAFEDYDWPGNVRELENVIERAVYISDEIIDMNAIPNVIRRIGANNSKQLNGDEKKRERHSASSDRRAEVIAALNAAENNVEKAAGLMGISKRTLYRRMQQYGISGKLSYEK